MSTTYNWLFQSPNPLKVAEYTEHGISEFMANVLINRNISIDQVKVIFNGFNELLAHELKVPVFVAESPLTCVAEGTGVMLDNIHMIDR